MATELINSSLVSCQKFKCSGRGLVLPFGIEACMSIPLRAVLYFIFLLYLFYGIAAIAEIFMSAIETITSKKQKIRYPDPSKKDEYLIVEVQSWNPTIANLTLMALGSSSPEILLSIIEIVGNRFEAGELGPGTIVGSAAYNLLVISALCILALKSPETRRVQLFNVFLVTSFFGFFAYIWMFIVLSVISKDVVELWEAVITFLMFPLVVILAFLAEKNFFVSSKIDMEEDEKELIFTPPELDETGSALSFRKDEILQFLRDLGQAPGLSIEDKAQLFSAKLSEKMQRSRLQYRIQGVRMLTGGKSLFHNLPDRLQETYSTLGIRNMLMSAPLPSPLLHATDAHQLSQLEFASLNYAILEKEQKVQLAIIRKGPCNVDVRYRLNTIDGTATAGEDYYAMDQEFVMKAGEQEQKVTITVIDDDQWEPDETFFVKLSLPEGEEKHAKLGPKPIAVVTIINDDEPGSINFEQPINLIKESAGKVDIRVLRINGADGRVSVNYRTKDGAAIAKKDYQPVEGELVFDHGEISKVISISIIDDLKPEKDENFSVELFDPTGGAQLGQHKRTIVTIINDDNYKNIASKMASLVQIDMDKLSVTKTTWGEQFRKAMNVNDGDLGTATVGHYIGHSVSFFWKVLFALVPPTSMAGGWLTFFVSLLFIALLTAVVGDVAAIFGCLVGLKDSITAISFVALGTSLPDTFASMYAAKASKTADDAIGNITGSNGVNVFLGLGLPWLVAAIYWESKNLPFTVKAGDLSFSVLVFSICCVLCMTVLFLRRFVGFFGKAELGGPTIPKYLCAIFFVILWIGYLTSSGLQAYGHIKWQS